MLGNTATVIHLLNLSAGALGRRPIFLGVKPMLKAVLALLTGPACCRHSHYYIDRELMPNVDKLTL